MKQPAKPQEFMLRGQTCRFMTLEAFHEIYHLEHDFAQELCQPNDSQRRDGNIEVSYQCLYPYHDEFWHLESVKHADGRQDLLIQTPRANYYVYDSRLDCPSQSVIEKLNRTSAENASRVFLLEGI
jgi:hypothetical protein